MFAQAPASIVGFGHRAALALAPAVDADPVEQVAPRAGPQHTSPATDTRPEPLPQAVTTGVCPRRAQVRAFGGQVLPGLVLEADPRPGRRR